jgi:hypothetical protein
MIGLRALAATLMLGLAATAMAQPVLRDFPFERELLLQAEPMRPGKRMPSLTIETNGRAVIDLWCRSIPGRVQLGEGTVAITAAVTPEDLAQQPLPAMQSAGQCTEPRIAADAAVLAALLAATGWDQRGDIVTFSGGPTALRFRPAGN